METIIDNRGSCSSLKQSGNNKAGGLTDVQNCRLSLYLGNYQQNVIASCGVAFVILISFVFLYSLWYLILFVKSFVSVRTARAPHKIVSIKTNVIRIKKIKVSTLLLKSQRNNFLGNLSHFIKECCVNLCQFIISAVNQGVHYFLYTLASMWYFLRYGLWDHQSFLWTMTPS